MPNKTHLQKARLILSLFLLMFVGLSVNHVFAQDEDTLRFTGIPKAPVPARLVNDYAHLLSPEQSNQLEEKLKQFSNETSNQIVVVIIDSLNGYDAASFATLLGQRWKVGQKKYNNGIVVLIKPKHGNERGSSFIAVGYGLEGAIPDATAKRITDVDMITNFKQGNYYEGIDKGTTTLIQLAKGEYSFKDYLKKNPSRKGSSPYLTLIIIGILVLFIFVIRPYNQYRINQANGVSDVGFWALLFMMGSTGGGGYYNDFSSGSGRFGGFGGGDNGFGDSGFGGFGGGDFGGGGAGGSW